MKISHYEEAKDLQTYYEEAKDLQTSNVIFGLLQEFLFMSLLDGWKFLESKIGLS